MGSAACCRDFILVYSYISSDKIVQKDAKLQQYFKVLYHYFPGEYEEDHRKKLVRIISFQIKDPNY
jgi:hypothetical protein